MLEFIEYFISDNIVATDDSSQSSNCSKVYDTTLWANIYVRNHLGCGTDSVFVGFCRSHKYFKDASDANKQDFENKLNLTCQAQSTPKTIGI